MIGSRNRSFAIKLALLALALTAAGPSGCATKRIINAWSNPAYAGAERGFPFRRIMVIGVTDQPAIRRNFEDRFVLALEAAGAAAIPSYRLFPENGKISEARLKAALNASGPDAVMITRLTHVERRTEVEPGFYHPYPGWRLYGLYCSAWYGDYGPPRVYDHRVYYSETTLHDVANDEIVWSGTIRTVEPENIKATIQGYVDALQSSGILRS